MNGKAFGMLTCLMFLLGLVPSSYVLAESIVISVDPSVSYVEVNATFPLNITVSNVYDLVGWEFKLYYLSAVLNGTGVVEGPFLKQGGDTFFYVVNFTDNYNATHGLVWATCTLLGAVPGVNGNGTLATITFRGKQLGSSSLSLADTLLADSKANPIPHTAVDATAYVLIHDVAVTGVSPLKTIVGQGLATRVKVTLENEGNYTETLNVTAYANTTVIETLTTTIVNGSSVTITFTWNTTGFAKGNYTVSAYAWPVQGETDTTDNAYINGVVKIVIPGDVSGDGKVDIKDILLVAKAFGTHEGAPNWDPNRDVNGDGKVDIKDIFITAKNYGAIDP